MRLECEGRHAQKLWAENLEILKKTSVGSRLWASRVGSLLGTSPVFQVPTGKDEKRSKTPRDMPTV